EGTGSRCWSGCSISPAIPNAMPGWMRRADRWPPRYPAMRTDRQPPYATPAAFRRALTDRLRAIAAPHGPWPLSDVQRQFAYDRLLTRLYLLDDAWIVKGATAMLARRIAVRHTIDIDIFRAAQRDQAERDLRTA